MAVVSYSQRDSVLVRHCKLQVQICTNCARFGGWSFSVVLSFPGRRVLYHSGGLRYGSGIRSFGTSVGDVKVKLVCPVFFFWQLLVCNARLIRGRNRFSRWRWRTQSSSSLFAYKIDSRSSQQTERIVWPSRWYGFSWWCGLCWPFFGAGFICQHLHLETHCCILAVGKLDRLPLSPAHRSSGQTSVETRYHRMRRGKRPSAIQFASGLTWQIS